MGHSLPATVYRRVVTEADTAAAHDARLPAAASTPFVLSLVEMACIRSIADDLDEGEVTVGTRVVLDHLKPTRVGTKLEAEAALEHYETDKGRYTWSVAVRESDRTPGVVVAKATHTRIRLPLAAIRDRLESSDGGNATSQ